MRVRRNLSPARLRKRSGEVDDARRSKNRYESKIPARIEHVFAVVRWLWGFVKVRYRGQTKDATRTFTALALSNIYMSRERLMARLHS